MTVSSPATVLFFHSNFCKCLEIGYAIMQSVDNFYILDVHNHIPGVKEVLNVITETFIMLC